MSNQPEHPRPDSPDPAGPPPPAYQPPSYAPGHAPLPEPDYPPTAQFPAQPVNYAPPGHAPDYGYPPPDQPGGGYPYGQPPPPPPRRSNIPIIAVIVAVTLLLCAGIGTAGTLLVRNATEKAKDVIGPATTVPTSVPELPTELPELPGLPTELPDGIGHKIKVTYEVSGDGPARIFYVEKLGEAPVGIEDVKLPWKFSTEMETPAVLTVVAVRAGTDEGSLRCRTLIDGDEVKKVESSSSNFATVTCSHLAID